MSFVFCGAKGYWAFDARLGPQAFVQTDEYSLSKRVNRHFGDRENSGLVPTLQAFRRERSPTPQIPRQG
jgi:hypothetical protein